MANVKSEVLLRKQDVAAKHSAAGSHVGCCKNPVSFAIPRNHVIVRSTLIVFSGESIFGGRSQITRCPLVVYMVLLQDPVALPVPKRAPSLVVKTWQQQRSDIDS